MIIQLGSGALFLAAQVVVYGAVAALIGARKRSSAWVESARLALLAAFGLITFSLLAILILILTNHFEVQYVYSVASRAMPVYLKVTALWGGQAGSLLFWSWLMSGFGAAAVWRKWDRDRDLLPWIILVCFVTLIFFLCLSIFVENPFVRFWQLADGSQTTSYYQPLGAHLIYPRDGSGLNPMLRHPGMIFHPPLLYLGFVSFIIPFAFAIAALAENRSDDRWLRLTRPWALIAWLFLSLGLIVGSRWAYDVLGWGGYWAWDPVEVAALLPWLSGTAFLHSIMIQEHRGIFKRWNIILILLTYMLVILGTFLTRSGVLSSVHAFSESMIGPLFFGFIALMSVLSLILLALRWNSLRAETEMTSLLSRESLFLLNNILFISILLICLWGILFPVISELFTDQKITVGPAWYKQIVGPLFGALVVLMGIAPLSAWGRSAVKNMRRRVIFPLAGTALITVAAGLSGIHAPMALLAIALVSFSGLVTLYEYGFEVFIRARNKKENSFASLWKLTTRNRRRYGGLIIHLGIVLMAFGIIGMEFLQTQTQVTLDRGESITFDGYKLTYSGLEENISADGVYSITALLKTTRNGKYLADLKPARNTYQDSQESITVPGQRTTVESDLYVVLVDWLPVSFQQATFKIYSFPLVFWLWFGGVIFTLGTVIAAFPSARKRSDQNLTN